MDTMFKKNTFEEHSIINTNNKYIYVQLGVHCKCYCYYCYPTPPPPQIKKCRKSWEICLLCFCCTQGRDTLRKHQNDLNVHDFMCCPLLYYKRVDPYLCSELVPVLEGSGSHGRYPQKGTSVDRVSVVFVARVDHRIFYYSPKTNSWWRCVPWR